MILILVVARCYLYGMLLYIFCHYYVKIHQIHPHQDKIYNVRKDTYIVSERGGWGHSYRLFFGIKISTFDTRPVQVQQKKSSSMTSFTCHNIDRVQQSILLQNLYVDKKDWRKYLVILIC
jgi:hypothetical protein